MLVRSDLPRGLMCAQIVHAAGESSPGNLPEGVHAVVLSVTEAQLLTLEQTLREHKVSHAAIRENDPPYTGQLLAIGIHPRRKEDVYRFVKRYPLVK